MDKKHTPQPAASSPRPPVIVIMGHVDHGKSTLLDYIRKTNTTAREAGGITQALGAYEAMITDKSGATHALTFLDTPGHEAFSGIRKRGTSAADIAVLVISGEDGVKPQTLEALTYIQESAVPYVVALNKIDRPGVDPERSKQNLAEHEIYVEGYGGSVPFIPISALTGKGIEDLLELLVLMAEMEHISGSPSQMASGFVIEAHMDSKKGATATVVIKDGTLTVGTYVAAGKSVAVIRAIDTSAGKVQSLACGRPALISGWDSIPHAGDPFKAFATKKEAEAAAQSAVASPLQKKEVFSDTDVVIPVVVKADSAGSLEALRHEIKKITITGARLKVIGDGIGTITENDVKLCGTGKKGIILGFNVKADSRAKTLAERDAVVIQTFDIIYKLTEWLSTECERLRPRIETETAVGKAVVIKLFGNDKDRIILGARMENGSILTGSTVRIVRRDTEIGKGKIKSLQQLKNRIDEAKGTMEFGATLESKVEPSPGDRIEAYTVELT